MCYEIQTENAHTLRGATSFVNCSFLISGMAQFRSGMYEETESRLKSSALAAMNLYDSQGYGNYAMKEDGNVWRGMNFNISKETSLVDSLKEQTEVDITFFSEILQ